MNSIYIKGKEVTSFYIHTLLCFKQYIFLLNNQLDKTDIESIICSLYSTITNAVTVPPNLLLLTIANVLIYVASNCSIQNIFNLPCTTSFPLSFVCQSLITNFFKETVSCQFIIQKQLLLFVIHLLIRNLQGSELQQALSTLISPIVNNILTPVSPVLSTRRTFNFRQAANPSVVMSSIFIRSVYLLTAVVKVSYTSNKAVRDVLYQDLLAVLSTVVQTLCSCFEHQDNSYNYDNCRMMWNFVLYASSILRGHKASYGSFLPLVGSLFNHLPALLSQVSNTVKAMICVCWIST